MEQRVRYDEFRVLGAAAAGTAAATTGVLFLDWEGWPRLHTVFTESRDEVRRRCIIRDLENKNCTLNNTMPAEADRVWEGVSIHTGGK